MSIRSAMAIILSIIWSAPALSQVVDLHVPSDAVYPGVSFEISAVVQYPDGYTLHLPQADGYDLPRWGDLTLLSIEHRDRSVGPERMIRDSLVFTAAAFTIQAATTTPGSMLLTSAADTIRAEIPARTILVEPALPDDAVVREISPVYRPPTDYLLIAGIVLGIFLAIAAIVVAFRRRQSSHEPDPVVKRPPFEEAMADLESLSTDSPSTEHDRPFVIRLSYIHRRYIARRLKIPAMERTSAELIGDLSRSQHVSDAMISNASSILAEIDHVKFAGDDLATDRTSLLKAVSLWIREAEERAARDDQPIIDVTAKS
jgi:hypothetical protein